MKPILLANPSRRSQIENICPWNRAPMCIPSSILAAGWPRPLPGRVLAGLARWDLAVRIKRGRTRYPGRSVEGWVSG